MCSGGATWNNWWFSCLPFPLLSASGHLAPNFPPGVHANQNARMLFDAFAHFFWISPSTLASAVFFKTRFRSVFPSVSMRDNDNWQMRKNTLLLQAKFLKAPDRLSEHATIVQFWSFFQKRRVFLCFLYPPVFHIFTSALRSKLQFDCKVGAS